MSVLPSDPPTTVDSDKEPMRWTMDDAVAAWTAGWGLHPHGPNQVMVPYPAAFTSSAQRLFDGLVLNAIQKQANDGLYVAQKAMAILTAQKLCGR